MMIKSVGCLRVMLAIAFSTVAAAPHGVARVPEAWNALDAQYSTPFNYRVIRFNATVALTLHPRPQGGSFRPFGPVIVETGSDPVLDPGRAAPLESVILSSSDSHGFKDQAYIRFSAGELRFESVHPTDNEPTRIDGLAQTVMVEKVTGGTGAFADATGYLLSNATVGKEGVRGTFTGIIFIRK